MGYDDRATSGHAFLMHPAVCVAGATVSIGWIAWDTRVYVAGLVQGH